MCRFEVLLCHVRGERHAELPATGETEVSTCEEVRILDRLHNSLLQQLLGAREANYGIPSHVWIPCEDGGSYALGQGSPLACEMWRDVLRDLPVEEIVRVRIRGILILLCMQRTALSLHCQVWHACTCLHAFAAETTDRAWLRCTLTDLSSLGTDWHTRRGVRWR